MFGKIAFHIIADGAAPIDKSLSTYSIFLTCSVEEYATREKWGM